MCGASVKHVTAPPCHGFAVEHSLHGVYHVTTAPGRAASGSPGPLQFLAWVGALHKGVYVGLQSKQTAVCFPPFLVSM